MGKYCLNAGRTPKGVRPAFYSVFHRKEFVIIDKITSKKCGFPLDFCALYRYNKRKLWQEDDFSWEKSLRFCPERAVRAKHP